MVTITVDCNGQIAGKPPAVKLPATSEPDLPISRPPGVPLPDDGDPEVDSWPAGYCGAGLAYP